jgi:hypothetical protein
VLLLGHSKASPVNCKPFIVMTPRFKFSYFNFLILLCLCIFLVYNSKYRNMHVCPFRARINYQTIQTIRETKPSHLLISIVSCCFFVFRQTAIHFSSFPHLLFHVYRIRTMRFTQMVRVYPGDCLITVSDRMSQIPHRQYSLMIHPKPANNPLTDSLWNSCKYPFETYQWKLCANNAGLMESSLCTVLLLGNMHEENKAFCWWQMSHQFYYIWDVP